MKRNREIIISGFALFSMFFGAGNLIFPPSVGLEAGSHWVTATLGFIATAVGFVMLGVLAAIKRDGSLINMGLKVSRPFAQIFSFLIVLCIGPGLAIPRTGATTHELIEASLLPNIPAYVICGIFFALVLYFSLSKGKVIDILGAYLTPALLVTLAVIIIATIVAPPGKPVPYTGSGVFGSSFEKGYQTMDCLASLMFASVIMANFENQGHRGEDLTQVAKKAAIVAGLGLTLIYGGLVYLGATVSGAGYENLSLVELLIKTTNSTLGYWGMVVLSAAMSLACLTTAIGLIVTCANYFRDMTKGKISYTIWVLILVFVSFFLSLGGVDYIVKVSGPILAGIYPVAITLILATLLDPIVKKRSTYIGLVLGALVPAISQILSFVIKTDYYGQFQELFSENVGTFAWVIFALALGILFSFLPIKENAEA